MELRLGKNGLWQVYISGNTERLVSVVVSANCFTGELFQKLNEHPRSSRRLAEDLELYAGGGTNRTELPRDNRQRLSDFGMIDRSTVSMVTRLPGGALPTEEQLEKQPRHLKPAKAIRITTSKDHPDVLGLDNENPRAIMPCGHAIAPISLALHLLCELKKGEVQIKCPESNCNDKWNFVLVRDAACLTQDENAEFENQLHKNYISKDSFKSKQCPKCGTFANRQRETDKRLICQNCTQRTGKNYEFCWTCLEEWTNIGVVTCGNAKCGLNEEFYDILAKCEMKDLPGLSVDGCPISCPSRRACPSCSIIIGHTDKCRNVVCTRCNYEFCFICLELSSNCKSNPDLFCKVAPRQTRDTKFIGITQSPQTLSISSSATTTNPSFGIGAISAASSTMTTKPVFGTGTRSVASSTMITKFPFGTGSSSNVLSQMSPRFRNDRKEYRFYGYEASRWRNANGRATGETAAPLSTIATKSVFGTGTTSVPLSTIAAKPVIGTGTTSVPLSTITAKPEFGTGTTYVPLSTITAKPEFGTGTTSVPLSTIAAKPVFGTGTTSVPLSTITAEPTSETGTTSVATITTSSDPVRMMESLCDDIFVIQDFIEAANGGLANPVSVFDEVDDLELQIILELEAMGGDSHQPSRHNSVSTAASSRPRKRACCGCVVS